MSRQETPEPGLSRRLFACCRGAVTVEFALIAVAMLIGIAVAVGDIGTSLTAGGDRGLSSL